MDTRWQIGQKTAGPVERFGFARDFIVDGAIARMNVAAAELFLVDVLADTRDNRRAGREQL